MAEQISERLPFLRHRPAHFNGNGLEPFALVILSSGAPIDFTNCLAECWLKDKKTDTILFHFPPTGENALTFQGTKIIFPSINEWAPGAGMHGYEVKVTFASGFKKSFAYGDWPIIQNIGPINNG